MQSVLTSFLSHVGGFQGLRGWFGDVHCQSERNPTMMLNRSARTDIRSRRATTSFPNSGRIIVRSAVPRRSTNAPNVISKLEDGTSTPGSPRLCQSRCQIIVTDVVPRFHGLKRKLTGQYRISCAQALRENPST
jgi:hypothetical protein